MPYELCLLYLLLYTKHHVLDEAIYIFLHWAVSFLLFVCMSCICSCGECMCTWVCIYSECIFVHKHVESRAFTLHVFLSYLPPYFLRKGLSLNLECLDLAGLPDHWALLPHSSALRLQVVLYWTTLVTITGHIGYEQQVAGVCRHFHFYFHMIYTCMILYVSVNFRIHKWEKTCHLSFWNWCDLLNMTVSVTLIFLTANLIFCLYIHRNLFIHPVCWWTCTVP